MTSSTLSVVVVNFDTSGLLRSCLRSVTAQEPDQLVVVDGGSSDDSVEMTGREFPQVRLLALADNPGYGAAANLGLATIGTPYALLLNADTEVLPDALRSFRSQLEAHPRAAVVGPRLLDPDGSLQPSCFPPLGSVRLALEKSWLGRRLARFEGLRERYLLSLSSHTSPRTVPWVLGAALALRLEAFRAVGGFDPGFFLYAEEVDLCHRLRRAGWEIRFAPCARVVHVGGASGTSRAHELRLRRIASAQRFYRKHYSAPRRLLLQLALSTALRWRWLRDSLLLRWTRNSASRRRLAEDVEVWRRALRRDPGRAR